MTCAPVIDGSTKRWYTSLIRFVAGVSRKLFAVETIIAAAPHTRITPRNGGRTSVATRMTTSSDCASVSPGSTVLANTPVESINVSTTIVPTIHPPTASRAARSSRAEKNFWYMFASPSRRNIVGRNRARAACGPRVPNSDT